MIENKESKKQSTELEKRSGGNFEATTPFRFARRFAEDMERLFADFQGFRVGSLFGREFFPFTKEFEHVDWVPKIEVLQHNDDLSVRADLPGLKKDEVKVELTKEALTISGERKEEKEDKSKTYYRIERRYGSFERSVALPSAVDAGKAKASYKDGILEISLPKKPEVKGKSIKIETEETK